MKHIVWLVVPLMFLGIFVPVKAASLEDAQRLQEESLELDKLERAASEVGGKAIYGETLDDGLAALMKTGSEAAGGVLKEALRSGVLLMVIAVFCALAETIYTTVGKDKIPVIPLIGTLGVAAVSVADVKVMLGLGGGAIEGITEFSNVLLPTVAAVTAATGAVTGAAVRQMAAVLFSDLLVNLINGLLVPMLYGYLAISIAHAAVGNDGLKQLCGFLKWTVTMMLTAAMTLFVGYLSVSGVIAGSADAATVKATKFAISGAIPVVGGILSDAAETILASAGVLRGTVGVFGVITVLSLCLLPLMRIAVHYLMYKLVAVVSATVGPTCISSLVDRIGGAFGLMLGMTGACSLLVLIALVSSITAVSM